MHVWLVVWIHYIQVDETPIPVLEKGKKQTHRGYYWVYYNPITRHVFFDYREGRGREGPEETLKNFNGYIQTDGYAVYERLNGLGTTTLLCCMAHARRYFEKALDNDQPRASHFLQQVQTLYQLERQWREGMLSAEQIQKKRFLQSKPILDELQGWLTTSSKEVLPKSTIGKAIDYSLQRWEKLTGYINDGRLQIDNNLVENQIRPVAIGRKNYLFAGSHEAAQRSAKFYSILGTLKAHSLDPFEYLNDVFERLPQTTINNINEFLPGNWKKD